jgi:dihydroorotase
MSDAPFDLIVRGHVLDPSQGLSGHHDIGIREGRIAAVASSLEGCAARTVLDVGEAYVTPGFIDIHAHVYAGVTSWGVFPDPPCLSSGVTTVVDAGSPGWTMLQGFRWYVHERSTVRALCFLHISGVGLVNAWVDECKDISHLDPETVGENVAENRDMVVGVKVRQGRQQVWDNGTEPLKRALEAARIADDTTPPIRNPQTCPAKLGSTIRNRTPVMCHIAAGIPLAEVLDLLRPADIVTHCFQGRGAELENLTDSRGRLLPEVVDARQKGVVMDVGHGGGSFRWEIAEAALEQGFLPDVISTDLHAYNLHGPVWDMAATLTKFLYLGMPLAKVLECATAAPARAIGRPDLGTLAVGSAADLAVISVVEEPVEMWDAHQSVRRSDRRLKVHATVRGGVVYRPGEIELETPETITRRSRRRGPDALVNMWRPYAANS